jgi:ABC-type phosphate transport system substrate-binding protein
MRATRTSLALLLLASLWLGLWQSATAARAASAEEFKVIVHPQNPLAVVDREFLRDAFLKKATNWPDGHTIRPIDLAGKLPARERFLELVLRKTSSQLRSYWTQRIFSGLDVPPPEADSAEAAIRYVLHNPGAVAYVPASVDTDGAKVVQVTR